jgi:hypothetical protein
VVVVAIACLAIGAYVSFRKGAVADGLEALGSALILLGICFMFTWPIKCRVATTKDLPCKEDAYGLLLGCRHHRMDKLRIRLGVVAAASLRNAKPAVGPETGMPSILAKDSVVSLTIDSGKGDTSGFVFGLISAVTGVASVAVGVLALH